MWIYISEFTIQRDYLPSTLWLSKIVNPNKFAINVNSVISLNALLTFKSFDLKVTIFNGMGLQLKYQNYGLNSTMDLSQPQNEVNLGLNPS